MKKLLLLPLVAFLSMAYAADSRIEVHGTSTLHDWMMASEEATVEIQRDADKITKLIVKLPIESLKSGDGSLDDNAYDTIYDAGIAKGESIIFTLQSHNDDGTFNGTFSIADKKQAVHITPANVTSNEINGTLVTQMTAFGLKPPTFLFGVMTTGDEIEIKYSVNR